MPFGHGSKKGAEQKAVMFWSAPAPLVDYVFDVMMLRRVDHRREPLNERLALLEKKVLPTLTALARPLQRRQKKALDCAKRALT